MGDELPVRSALERLLGEGLDRHDAIHAIASVLVSDMRRMMRQAKDFSLEKYCKQLNKLNAKAWRQGE